MNLEELKAEVKAVVGREVGVEKTRLGKYICKFVDFNNPHPAALVGDTEEIAYQNLLEYLQKKETQDGRSSAGQPAN